MMLEFNIRNQEISRIDSFSPAEKSVGYLVAKFNFKTEDWNGATKRAIFRNVKSKVEKDTMLEEDSCIVPWEVLVGSSVIEVSVHGVIDTENITTNVAECNLNRTLQGGSATQEPSPTVYEQMLKEMQDTKEIAQSVRDDADAGKFNGNASINQEALLQLAIKPTTDKSPFHHITDSANMKVLDFGMEGKTEQETVPGNQLFDKNTVVDGVLDVDGSIMSGDGYSTSDYILVNARESYYITKTGSMRAKYFDSDKNPITTDTYSDVTLQNGCTFAIPDNAVYLRFSMLNENIDMIMLNKGDTALPIEEYVGGIPSPNPDHPQEITNAGVYNEETGRYGIGLNFYQLVNAINTSMLKPQTTNGITATPLDDGGIQLSGTFTSETEISTWSISKNLCIQPGYVYKYLVFDENKNISNINSLVSFTGVSNVSNGASMGKAPSSRTLISRIAFTITSQDDIKTYYPMLTATSTETYVQNTDQPLTLTSPVPLAKWDYLTKRDGVWGWSIQSKEYNLSADECTSISANSLTDTTTRMYINNIIGKKYADCLCEIFPHHYMWHTGKFPDSGFFYGETFCIQMSNKFLEPYGYTYDESDYETSRTNVINALLELIRAHDGIRVWVDMQEKQAFHPLPDEEQTLLSNLETYYGVTNLYNDQGCPMWLTYVADTKLYVDSKLLEIQQAMI